MINFNQIIENKEYRERVIKYFRLPIRLSVSKDKFLSDLEFIRETDKDKYDEIIELTEHDFNKLAIEQDTSLPDFTMEDILEPLLSSFESKPSWQEFLKQDYSNILDDFDGVKSTHGFYVKENDNKCFLSIDLSTANWQSLQSIVSFDDNYEDLIVKYTDNLIPPVSKTFRTKITGLLGAKNIMDYNKKLLKDNKPAILEVIFKQTNVDLRQQEPFAFYADEFLIEINKETKDKFNELDIRKLESSIFNEVGVKVHFRPFQLVWLDINKSCAKIYDKVDYEIINISKDILLLLNKIICNKPLKDIDFEGIKLNKETKEEFIQNLNQVIVKINNSLNCI